MYIDATPHPISRVVSMRTGILIYSGKPAEFRIWIEALKNKARIYNLTSTESVSLAYDYSDSTFSEYVGLFLKDIKCPRDINLFKSQTLFCWDIPVPLYKLKGLLFVFFPFLYFFIIKVFSFSMCNLLFSCIFDLISSLTF